MRPLSAAVLRNRTSAIGVALTTASALLFLVLLALGLAGVLENPYAGIVVFIMVPAFFVLGLLLIPLGLWRGRRRSSGRTPAAWPTLNLGDVHLRRTLVFVAVATLINLAILSLASFGAVKYSESQAFCGQACHSVMAPEFTAHQLGPHARVHCVSCHVGPGAGGFITAKLNGTRQLYLAATGKYHRPIPTPVQNMPAVAGTCERCHWPDRFVGDVTKVLYEHADDEANTVTKTSIRLHVGGAAAGDGSGIGIHWHTNPANLVEYVARDDTREDILYVRATLPDGQVREYFADGVTAADVDGRPRRRMDCLDCHNRPAHTFGTTPERAVDAAMGDGLIDATLPFIRREAVQALKAAYPSHEAAAPGIERSIAEAVPASQAHPEAEASLRRAIAATQVIYARSVFPSMSVGWGTYPNQIGHTTSNGCFRCHDDGHKTRDGLAIRQDCEMCHSFE